MTLDNQFIPGYQPIGNTGNKIAQGSAINLRGNPGCFGDIRNLETKILQATLGRGMKNSARFTVIFCCRKIAGLPAKQFSFSHYGGVSVSFAQQINKDPYLAELMLKQIKYLN